MAFVTTYVTNKSALYLGEGISTNLSLALWLTDDYTKKEPVGCIRVVLMGEERKVVKNLSGYYLFNGLKAGKYTVIIESDFYFLKEKGVNIPLPDSKKPVVDIVLEPKPSYPFPDNATLVRGLVSSTPRVVSPVVNADLEVEGKSLKTKTDEKGEFVLYFTGVKKEDITIKIRDIKKTVSIKKEGEKINLGVITFP